MSQEIMGDFLAISCLTIPGNKAHAEHKLKLIAVNAQIDLVVKRINQSPDWVKKVQDRIQSDGEVRRILNSEQIKAFPYFVSCPSVKKTEVVIQFLAQRKGDESGKNIVLVSFPYVSGKTLEATPSDFAYKTGRLEHGFFTPASEK